MTYNLEETLELLQRAVDEKGEDHIAPRRIQADAFDDGNCVYREKDGTPSCIVGHVFSYIGVLDKATEGDSVSGQPQEIRDLFTEGALTLLWYAQRKQDRGIPWGGVVLDARNEVGDDDE